MYMKTKKTFIKTARSMNQIHPLAVVDPEAKLGDGNVIGPFCVIDKNVVIGDNNKLLNNVTISRGTASKGKTIVGNGNLLMENMHVAHDCVIGNGCIIGNSTKFAGEVVVEDYAIISATCLFHQFIRIGSYVMFQGGSRTSQDIPPYVIAGKEPVRYAGVNLIGLRRRGFSTETIEAIHDAYRIIYAQGVLKDGIAEARAKYPDSKEVEYICSFIESSKRGIIR